MIHIPHPIGVAATLTSLSSSFVIAQADLVDSPGELVGFGSAAGIIGTGLFFIVRMLNSTTNSTIQDLARKDKEIQRLTDQNQRQSQRIDQLINALVSSGNIIPEAITVRLERPEDT